MELAEIKAKLRRSDFWLSEELAKAFGVSRWTIQRLSKQHDIGQMKLRSVGARGQRIYLEADLKKFCEKLTPRH